MSSPHNCGKVTLVSNKLLWVQSAAVIGTRANKGQGMFPWLQQIRGRGRLRDEAKECLRGLKPRVNQVV